MPRQWRMRVNGNGSCRDRVCELISISIHILLLARRPAMNRQFGRAARNGSGSPDLSGVV
ncbi:hypothetical protein ZHAS_00014395 [Anopheles sinensis]|uniref:Uncharacterized protein n=1 Tax=Anopheles sinensis TaxID=74873 RepID=A0A084W813_ANOSI|nr:hypothetical protein ZHAS_00014395 [Anopheles sinensis]